MREIKFRGISVKHHNMIFGDLVQNDSSTGRYLKVAIKERGCYPHEVDPATLGQYTENKDITRTKELYVGDIVQAPRNCKTLCVIKFKPHVGFYAEGKGGVYITGLSLDECLWKGNIHENANLLTNE